MRLIVKILASMFREIVALPVKLMCLRIANTPTLYSATLRPVLQSLIPYELLIMTVCNDEEHLAVLCELNIGRLDNQSLWFTYSMLSGQKIIT